MLRTILVALIVIQHASGGLTEPKIQPVVIKATFPVNGVAPPPPVPPQAVPHDEISEERKRLIGRGLRTRLEPTPQQQQPQQQSMVRSSRVSNDLNLITTQGQAQARSARSSPIAKLRVQPVEPRHDTLPNHLLDPNRLNDPLYLSIHVPEARQRATDPEWLRHSAALHAYSQANSNFERHHESMQFRRSLRGGAPSIHSDQPRGGRDRGNGNIHSSVVNRVYKPPRASSNRPNVNMDLLEQRARNRKILTEAAQRAEREQEKEMEKEKRSAEEKGKNGAREGKVANGHAKVPQGPPGIVKKVIACLLCAKQPSSKG